MIPVSAFAGRRVAVFGLGRTGRAAARALEAGGASVSAWDDNEATRAAAAGEGVTLDDLNKRDWGDIAALVLSPGVPLTHPKPHRMVELARAVGAPVIGDMELFALALREAQDVRVCGITGTNGKSTTTALLGHILKTAGRDVRVGGNIGEAVLNLDRPRPGAVYVIEMSSYQLDLVESLTCDVSVFLNLSPDHLDRHGDIEGYTAAKRRIFANPTPGDAAVVGVDDAVTKKIFAQLKAANGRAVYPVSSTRALSEGVYAIGGVLYDAIEGRAEAVMRLDQAPSLPGDHNAQNAAAAYAAARRLGVTREDAATGLRRFPGLAHRQERAGEIGPVRFINDSKATNADAAARALGCYDDIYWIAGGQAKSDGAGDLARFAPRIRRAYLIGRDADRFERELSPHMETRRCGDIERATALAARDALAEGAPAPVVLLSPACASFDQFTDFEARGAAFKDAVSRLIARASGGDAA